MNHELHVAVDFDDVVWEFVPFLFECFEREFGVKLPYDGNPWGADAVAFRDGTNHDAWAQCGYTDWWGWLRERDWLWGILPIVPGAIGGIRLARERGWRVEGLTKKPAWAEFTVWKLMRDWRPPFHTVTVAPSSAQKVDWTEADVLVDDSVDNCLQFCYSGRAAIVFDRGDHHSELIGTNTGLYVVNSWGGVTYTLDCLAKEKLNV